MVKELGRTREREPMTYPAVITRCAQREGGISLEAAVHFAGSVALADAQDRV